MTDLMTGERKISTYCSACLRKWQQIHPPKNLCSPAC